MPRDNDKNNDSRGRRDRPSGGKGRSGAARGPEKKFAKRGFDGKRDGRWRAASLCRQARWRRSYGEKPYCGLWRSRMPASATARRRGGTMAMRRAASTGMTVPRDRPFAIASRAVQPRRSSSRGEGEKRPYTPRGDRPNYNRDDRAPRGDRGDAGRPRDFRTKSSATRSRIRLAKAVVRSAPIRRAVRASARWRSSPRRWASPIIRAEATVLNENSAATRNFARGAPDRGPRKDFGSRPDRGRDRKRRGDRGNSKPWQKRDASSPDHVGRNSRPPRDGARNFDRPRFEKPREDRGGDERP